MKDGSRVRTVRFEAPVYIAELHPFNQYVFSLTHQTEWHSNLGLQSVICRFFV